LQNRGPVELVAQITGMPLEPVVLGGYQKVLVGLRRKPDAVTAVWKNLYIRSTENLTLTHALAEMGRQDPPSTSTQP
jgi:hypothetical protein